MTWWELVGPLRRSGERVEVLNITRTGNRLLPSGTRAAATSRRRFATWFLERGAGGPLGALGIPTVAFGPFLEHVCLQKLDRDA